MTDGAPTKIRKWVTNRELPKGTGREATTWFPDWPEWPEEYERLALKEGWLLDWEHGIQKIDAPLDHGMPLRPKFMSDEDALNFVKAGVEKYHEAALIRHITVLLTE